MNIMKNVLTNKNIVHIAMYIFGAYSAMNIATFFININHPIVVSWLLGLALGIGLISASIYLSRQDYTDVLPFSLLLVAVLLLAALSGQIQYLAYLTHTETAPYAFVLGFAPPFIVELVLALAVSFAEKSERTKMQRDSKAQITDQVALAMTDMFANIDTSRIKKQIEKKIDAVINAQVDNALLDLLPDVRRQTPIVDRENDENSSMHSAQTEDFKSKAAQINKERAQKKEQELKAFAQFLADNYNNCATDDLNISEIERTFGKSRRTIKRYINELQQADIINGHIDKALIAQL